MAPPLSRLHDLKLDVLQAVIDYYAAHDAELPVGGRLPAKQFVSAGPPAWDCEQLVVHTERTMGIEGNVAQEVVQPVLPHAGHAMRAAEVMVTLVRCHPTAQRAGSGKVLLPSVEQEEAVAAVVDTDGIAVLNALVAAERAGLLPHCHSVAFLAWQVVTAEGGLVGSQLRVRLGLGSGP